MSWQVEIRLEAFHGKRDTYNCSIDAYISNKSRTLLIGHSYFCQELRRINPFIHRPSYGKSCLC
jgi:hypothetical protein